MLYELHEKNPYDAPFCILVTIWCYLFACISITDAISVTICCKSFA